MATRSGSGSKGGKIITGQGTGGGSQTGSNWTNLSQYLDANKGAGAGMAEGITQNTQNEVNRIDKQGGAVDTWDTEARKQTDSNTRQDTYSQTINNGTSQDIKNINQDAYSSWKNLGNYYGAKDASGTKGYDQVYKDVNNTKDQIKNLNSYEGQKNALQSTYGKSGNYGKGFQSLDAFALNGDQSGQEKLQAFQTQNANFGQKFDTAKAGVNNYIEGAADRGKAVMDRTNQAISSRSTGYLTPAQQAAQNDDGGYAGQVKAIQDKYASEGLAAPTTLPGARAVNTADRFIDRQAGDASAYMEDIDRDALNALSGMDDDLNTGTVAKGNKASAATDWEAILADIASQKPQPIASTPMEVGVSGSADESDRILRNLRT